MFCEELGFGMWIGMFELNLLEEDEREFFKGKMVEENREGVLIEVLMVV